MVVRASALSPHSPESCPACSFQPLLGQRLPLTGQPGGRPSLPEEMLPNAPLFSPCRCQASFCDTRLPRRRVGANGGHVCSSPAVKLTLVFRAPDLKSSVFSTTRRCLRRSERRVSQPWAQPDPAALGGGLPLGTTRAWAGWSAWLVARYRHCRQRTTVVGLSVGGSSSSHSASTLTWLPLLSPSVGAHHRLLKAACYQPGEPCFGAVLGRQARLGFPSFLSSFSVQTSV